MLDRFDREISYLRISVTEHCNLLCSYCVPVGCVLKQSNDDRLSAETIIRIVREAEAVGIRKVRLTGGEPLVRKDIVEIVAGIKECSHIEHLAMTTNAVLLPRYAERLRDAGLDTVNISLDSLDDNKYADLTRNGRLEHAMRGIEAARSVGFTIKINMVVFNETGDSEVQAMQRFCDENGMALQLINHYDLTSTKFNRYRFDRPPNCLECNRIRLLADGCLKPCLHSNDEIPVDMENICESLERAVFAKPLYGTVCTNRSMVQIGG